MSTTSESTGLRRSVDLLRAFRQEQTDPDLFYGVLARDTVAQISRHLDLAGRVVIDVGGAAGYFTEAFRDRGARCHLIEPDPSELFARGRRPRGAVAGDGYRLPLRDGVVDLAFSSNVLEHVRHPWRFLDEMVRVTRCGGMIYTAFTNWYSPWGGHETSPWHYLGGQWAIGRYERKYGKSPKNRYRENLFPVHVSETLTWARSRADLEVVDAMPRYYPRWGKVILMVPGVREVATWNLVLMLRRR